MEFSLADSINTALLLATTLGVSASFIQIKAGAKAQRATFLKDLYLQLRTDSDIAEAFYLIEYGEFQYTPGFHGSALEKKVDSLLTFIDLVCEMHAQRIISKREMGFFNYQFSRVANNQSIQDYLGFLGIFYADNHIEKEPFSSFQRHARASYKLFQPTPPQGVASEFQH